jgi:hypothetical protein
MMSGKGYHNDQFFNLQGESSALQADNPPFTYPSKIIRTGVGKNTLLKRGYIRTLVTTEEAVKFGTRKCNFQFNPTTFTSSVMMSTGMLNMMQQDPGQFAQPMSASQNFAFTLLFDRSMEINNDDGKFKTRLVGKNGQGAQPDLWNDNSPGQVGVLRDLGALYGAIGQGFSSKQRDYVEQVLRDTIKAEASSTSADSDAIAKRDKAYANLDKSSDSNFLDMNLGNSAFLLPVPVRVVFSSLYVVEGLVTNTSVVFTKFSSSLVPMQCSVTITMEAKYIGFSKKKTFFTDVLEQRQKMKEEEAAQVISDNNALLAAVSGSAQQVYVRTAVSSGSPPSMTSPHSITNVLAPSAYSSLICKVAPANETGNSADPLWTMMDGGTSVTVGIDATFSIYGPFNSFSINITGIESALKAAPYNKLCFSGALSSSDGNQTTATSASEWIGLTDGCYSNVAKATTSSVPNYDPTKYYVYAATASITASGSGSSITGKGSYYGIIQPGDSTASVELTVPLNWPKKQVDTAKVPADNAATKPNKNDGTGNTYVPANSPTAPKT